MKKVFKTDEVAHIWAQQKQDEGRNPQGNFYFDKQTIYSYGGHFPIATFARPDLVLITSRGYSPTTSKHIHHVRGAVSHINSLEVFDPTAALYPSQHAANLERLIAEFAPEQKRALKSRLYFDDIKGGLIRRINHAGKYADTFKKHIGKEIKKELSAWRKRVATDTLFTDKERARIKAQLSAELVETKKRNAERRAAEAARAAERARTQMENLDRWLNGEDISTYNLPSNGVWLRLRKQEEEIQTSRGASIPISAALVLWEKLIKKQPLHGLELGSYRVTGFDGFTLEVGCHNIPTKQIYKMAKALELPGLSEVAQ